MRTSIHKIITNLVKELEASITEKVIEKLRDSYVGDVTAIVKDCLNNNELYSSNSGGWITIQDAAKKYKMSTKAVGDKCRIFKEGIFKIERKRIGRHHLLNEKQFIEACGQKVGKQTPNFLKKLKRA